MLHLLQRHAVPIKAHFRASLVLTYAVPAAALRPLLSPGLSLDTFGESGFLAIALVETRDLRPAFLPAGLGMSFFLAGYRIFTRYRTLAGRTLRGLKILRSDTDRWPMQVFGNWMTHYDYARSRCEVQRTYKRYAVQVTTRDGLADLQVEADLREGEAALPAGSPFSEWRDARRFAGPLPFTFSYERQSHSLIRVEGVREDWKPRAVSVEVRRNTFLEQAPFRACGAQLASAFFLEDVPYAWRAGVRERLP